MEIMLSIITQTQKNKFYMFFSSTCRNLHFYIHMSQGDGFLGKMFVYSHEDLR